MLRSALSVVSIAIGLLFGSHVAAADCLSGPGNGTSETGDCIDTSIEGTPKGFVLTMFTFGALGSAAFDGKAMEVGVRRVSGELKVIGVISGALTLGMSAWYVAEYGHGDDGIAVGLAGSILGVPALVGGIVGLALGKPKDDAAAPMPGLIGCTGPHCRVSVPLPRVGHQRGGTTIVVPLVGARW